MDYSRGAVTPKISPFIQPPLNRYFIPRPNLPYKEPIDRSPDQRTGCRHSGIRKFLELVQEQYHASTSSSSNGNLSSVDAKTARKLQMEEKLKNDIDIYLSSKKEFKSDPFKTIFVGRLPYSITEKQLRREFEIYGPIKSISIITKPDTSICRGYAFIEFEKERSVKAAYSEADGKKINGLRRCLVDVERGRTVRGWLPRRLGGGLGSTRKGPPELCYKGSGREPQFRHGERKSSRSPPRAHSRGSRKPSYDDIDRREPKSPRRNHFHAPESYRVYKDIDNPSTRREWPRSQRDFFK